MSSWYHISRLAKRRSAFAKTLEVVESLQTLKLRDLARESEDALVLTIQLLLIVADSSGYFLSSNRKLHTARNSL